jgi:hypothetical protein
MQERKRLRFREEIPKVEVSSLVIIREIPEEWKQEARLFEEAALKEIKVFPPFLKYWITNQAHLSLQIPVKQDRKGLRGYSAFPTGCFYEPVGGTIPASASDWILRIVGDFIVESIRGYFRFNSLSTDQQRLDTGLKITADKYGLIYLRPYSLVMESEFLAYVPHTKLIYWSSTNYKLVWDYENPIYPIEEVVLSINNQTPYDLEFLIAPKMLYYTPERRVEAFKGKYGTALIVW